MTSKVGSLIVSFIFLSPTLSDLIRTHVYRRNWDIPDVPFENKKPFMYFGQPDLHYHENGTMRIHADHIVCSMSTKHCEVTVDCINCDDDKTIFSDSFDAPNYESLYGGKVDLHLYRNNSEHITGIVIDWASKVIVPAHTTLDRMVQDVFWYYTPIIGRDGRSHVGNEINVEYRRNILKLSDRDNGNRNFVSHHYVEDVQFTYIYSDYEKCPETGWTKLARHRQGSVNEFECIPGLRNTSRPMETAIGPLAGSRSDELEFYLDKDADNWGFYRKINGINDTKLLYKFKKADNRSDLLRLSHFNSFDGVVCRLPNIEHPKSNVHCHVVGLQAILSKRKITLNFPYKVHDFEVDIVDSRIVALTSSSTEWQCKYDLWEFDMYGKGIDGPFKIEGPPNCIYSRRLDPRPVIEVYWNIYTGITNKFCVGFTFEMFSENARVRAFSVNAECFNLTKNT